MDAFRAAAVVVALGAHPSKVQASAVAERAEGRGEGAAAGASELEGGRGDRADCTGGIVARALRQIDPERARHACRVEASLLVHAPPRRRQGGLVVLVALEDGLGVAHLEHTQDRRGWPRICSPRGEELPADQVVLGVRIRHRRDRIGLLAHAAHGAVGRARGAPARAGPPRVGAIEVGGLSEGRRRRLNAAPGALARVRASAVVVLCVRVRVDKSAGGATWQRAPMGCLDLTTPLPSSLGGRMGTLSDGLVSVRLAAELVHASVFGVKVDGHVAAVQLADVAYSTASDGSEYGTVGAGLCRVAPFTVCSGALRWCEVIVVHGRVQCGVSAPTEVVHDAGGGIAVSRTRAVRMGADVAARHD